MQPQDIDLDMRANDSQMTTEATPSRRALTVEKCMYCKKTLLVLVYIFFVLALGVCVSWTAFLHELHEPHPYMTYIELDEHQCWKLFYMWFLATFGFGYVGVNSVRLFFAAAVAKRRANDLFEAWKIRVKEDTNEIGKREDVSNNCTKIFIPESAVEIALDMLFVLRIFEKPEDFYPKDVIALDNDNAEEGIEMKNMS